MQHKSWPDISTKQTGEIMKRKKKRCQGAVTVFLTLILVPCIIVVCAFDDISRVQLSRAGAASAADLSLYSLMAEYDVDLKEYYGLIASCQNITDFYDKTKTYFCGMMDAKGMGEGSSLFTEYINTLQQGDVSDFLQTEVTNAVTVEAADGAQMGENPALIEDGIVEFMKYRGPASILSNIIGRFTELDLSGVSSRADEDYEVAEKKNEYAKAEGDLLGAALYSYLAVYDYEKEWEHGNPLREKGYEGLAADLTHIWNDLNSVTRLVTKYYFEDTDRMAKVNFPVYSSVSAGSAASVGTLVVKEDGSSAYCIDAAALQSVLQGIDEAAAAIGNARSSIESRFPQYTASGDDAPAGDNPAVYMLDVQDTFASAGELDVISDNMDLLLDKYAQISAAKNCEPFPDGDDLPADWQSQLSQVQKKIRDIQETVSPSGSSAYSVYVRKYNDCVSKHFGKVKNKGYTFQSSFTKGRETLGSFASRIANMLPELRSELLDLVSRLSVAIDGGEVTVNGRKERAVSLDELADKAAAYRDAREQWGAAADRHGTEYAKQESAVYHGTADENTAISPEEKASEEIAAKIDRESAGQLKTRLSNIRKDMQDFLNAMDTFTYGGEKIETVRNADSLVSCARRAMPPKSSRSLSQNETDAGSYFHALIHPGTEQVFNPPAADRGVEGNDPDLTVSTPQLYAFFKTRFGDEVLEIEKKKKENDEKNEQYQKKAEDEEKSSKEPDESLLTEKGGSITGGHGGDVFGLGRAISSIVGSIGNIIDGNGDELRDQLYVCEYIMDMFSYSTINLEEKKDQKSAKQSLTNLKICRENNQANLGEVEYILYGKETVDDNLKECYDDLYVLRSALNFVSGFVNFYYGNNSTARAINEAAIAIAAATCGVVPVPVSKCTLIGLLVTMESSHDLKLLKQGKPAVFYKMTDKDWYYAFHLSGGNIVFPPDGRDREDDGKGMYYSDYMYLFLLTGLTSDMYPAMLLRTGDLIEANMKLKKGGDYDLAKSLCYFHLKAQLRVKPLMLTLPIVSSMEGVDASGVLENKDWCTYEVDIYRGYS